MEDVKGKVAFITGGASGIGLGTAKAFVKNGMKVCIIDMRQDALDEAMSYFKEHGTADSVHPINLNITDREAYAAAADEAERVFGKIHVLFNNAGVGSGGSVVTSTFKDWDYSMMVNVGGVINGIVTILPRIQKHGEGGHVVSTSSTVGLFAMIGCGIYTTTKFAVTGLMESLASELEGTGIGASVLYPGGTTTNLGLSSTVNRPDELKNENELEMQPPLSGGARPPMMDTSTFMDPVEVGERVLRAIKRNDIFIHTHPEFRDGIICRQEAVLRAIPDEPPNVKRSAVLRGFGTLVYNPIYERQTTPGPPDWD
ncbi:MAG: SDR family NAD(P)-dependent oxidoreductase [Dehalococcoidales bacterium]|nr:SDR family NAD(P)-dependent oxidoreductase [Dehalococcoidales bacterium]